VLGMVAASGCDAKDIKSWSCKACPANVQLENINVTTAKGHLAFTAWDTKYKRIQVILRGSVSIKDWISDFHFPQTDAYDNLGCTNCKVHEGLLETFRSLQDGIDTSVEALLKTYGTDTEIAIAGHSLGGAVALHTAIHFSLERKWKIGKPVYTFGQPRVGNSAFANWIHSVSTINVLRSVHWNDPVPHLAPEGMLDYHHAGRELWWSEKMQDNNTESGVIVCDTSGEDPNCSDSIVAALVGTDHWYYLGHKVVQCSPF